LEVIIVFLVIDVVVFVDEVAYDCADFLHVVLGWGGWLIAELGVVRRLYS
jgi:hypothetical protein